MLRANRRFFAILFVLAFSAASFAAEQLDAPGKLAAHLDKLVAVIQGKSPAFCIELSGTIPGVNEKSTLRIGKAGDHKFLLQLDGPREFKGTLICTPERFAFDVPSKGVTFVGASSPPEGTDQLNPEAILKAALKLHPIAQTLWPAIEKGETQKLVSAGALFINIVDGTKAEIEAGTDCILLQTTDKKLEVSLKMTARPSEKWSVRVKEKGNVVADIDVAITETCAMPEIPKDRKAVSVERKEIETCFQRGAMRAIDILYDDFYSALPADKKVEVANGRLEIKDGQRTAWITGTSFQMGKAHGQLLAPEVRKLVDSTLYVVGTFYSVSKGSWFLNDMRDAWRRLEPFCDKDYLEEMRGLCEGAGLPYEEMKVASVFPELFHCSGFAVAGDATVGGKLYHGRVLDYMTQIGLQNAQCDFIIKRDGCRGWVNVGYAGFVGTVTGMNDAQISLGEMGGRGEGNWDGTPMAFLMRQVLEKSETLEQAQDIFRNAKRTCEYYYVIADGKTRTACGVAAWPDKIQFLKQGEAHELLPNSVPGCILLSAGDRYQLLSKRAKDGYGKIDEAAAIDLMGRPVAMSSNLHSVLFVPEDQIYHVAHASLKGHQPAAMQRYVRHSLKDNLKILEEVKATKTAGQ